MNSAGTSVSTFSPRWSFAFRAFDLPKPSHASGVLLSPHLIFLACGYPWNSGSKSTHATPNIAHLGAFLSAAGRPDAPGACGRGRSSVHRYDVGQKKEHIMGMM